MPLNGHAGRLGRAVLEDCAAWASFTCLFAAAGAVSCLQSGFNTVALVLAGLSGAVVVAGLAARIRAAVPALVRAAPGRGRPP